MTVYNDTIPYNFHIPYNGVSSLGGLTGLCDPTGRIIEFDVYIAPDGEVYNLHTPPVRAVISLDGDGIPPINYITQHGPYQHGQTIIDYFLQPRTIQVVLRANGRSRTDWYWIKKLLVDALRPNRTPGMGAPQPGVLRRYMPNGKWIDLDVVAAKGPGFTARNLSNWDEWSFQETIQFIAHNPIYYNPVPHALAFSNPINQLVFPVTFPILFGALDVTQNVTYLGDWMEFPSITVSGPLLNPTIVNVSTGEKLSLNYSLPVGRHLTYTLPYNLKQVLLDDGTSLAPYLTNDSSMATFHLAPNPEVDGGVNAIHVYGNGTAAGSAISMSWHDRYIALEIFS